MLNGGLADHAQPESPALGDDGNAAGLRTAGGKCGIE